MIRSKFDLFLYSKPSVQRTISLSSDMICGMIGDSIQMCPLCHECASWFLSDICFTSKMNRMFDNAFTVIFSLAVNFWGLILKNIKFKSFLIYFFIFSNIFS